ncbi:MAG: hypothetical protein ACI8Y7_000380 [Candidatus Woesearchaeota archaeon]|jgi:hypothetical protein
MKPYQKLAIPLIGAMTAMGAYAQSANSLTMRMKQKSHDPAVILEAAHFKPDVAADGLRLARSMNIHMPYATTSNGEGIERFNLQVGHRESDNVFNDVTYALSDNRNTWKRTAFLVNRDALQFNTTAAYGNGLPLAAISANSPSGYQSKILIKQSSLGWGKGTQVTEAAVVWLPTNVANNVADVGVYKTGAGGLKNFLVQAQVNLLAASAASGGNPAATIISGIVSGGQAVLDSSKAAKARKGLVSGSRTTDVYGSSNDDITASLLTDGADNLVSRLQIAQGTNAPLTFSAIYQPVTAPGQADTWKETYGIVGQMAIKIDGKTGVYPTLLFKQVKEPTSRLKAGPVFGHAVGGLLLNESLSKSLNLRNGNSGKGGSGSGSGSSAVIGTSPGGAPRPIIRP